MSSPRNLLILHAHDMGRYHSAYGYDIPTPRMRAFAEEGTTFRHAFCAAPTCSPSRAAMLTGFAAHEMGMLGLVHRNFDLNDRSKHLARRLSARGFHTVRCGIQHEYNEEVGEIYDTVLEEEPGDTHQDLRRAEAAAAFFETQNRDQPWFLWVGFIYPHRDFLTPDPERHPADRVQVPPLFPDTAAFRQDMAAYHATVEVTDQAVGTILDALEVSGQAADTLVILTTDHGIAFPGMKCSLTQHGTGITWIMRHPETIPAGVSKDALVSHLDFVPTVMDFLGLPAPGDGHGVSVKPVLDGDVEEVREDAFAEVNVHAGIEPKRSVRTHRHNYIRIFESDPLPVLANIDNSISKETWIDHGYAERPRDPVQVYDLVLDPQERHNVAEDPRYADVRNQMEQRLQNWMQRTNDPLLQGPLVVPAGSIVTPRDECSPGGETVVLQKNQTVI